MNKVPKAKVVENAFFGALLAFVTVFAPDDLGSWKAATIAAAGAVLMAVKSFAAAKLVGDETSTNFFGQRK